MSKKAKSKIEECPICESSEVSEITTTESISDRGNHEHVIDGYRSSVCGECEFEFVTAKQGRINEQMVEDARRQASELLTTSDIRTIRKRFDLRQEDASLIFGGGANAFSKYERGYITQSVSMDRLLRVADRFPEVVPYLQKLGGVAVSAPKITWRANFEDTGFKSVSAVSAVGEVIGLYVARHKSTRCNQRLSEIRPFKPSRVDQVGSSNDDSWETFSASGNG